jgi:hypothetical protein
MIFYPNPAVRESLASLQQISPILVSFISGLLARTVRDTTKRDCLNNIKADLPSIRRVRYCGFNFNGDITYISYQSSKLAGLFDVFFAVTTDHEHPAVYTGTALWLALLCGDLKKADMIKEDWGIVLVRATVCTALLGPGAALLAGWAWREEVLASKRH